MRADVRGRRALVGAVALVIALLVAACGGGAPRSAGGATVLRVGLSNPLSSLDPHVNTSPSTAAMPYLEPVYDRLVRLGPGLRVEPMLATSWEFSPDGRTLTLKLRENVTFSDGAPLTADAVKRSLDRLKTVQGAAEARTLKRVTAVTAVDPLTVALSLDGPAADLPAQLATAAGIVVSPNAIDSPDLASRPVGVGPYVVTSFRSGDRVVYERNPTYWNPADQRVDRIELAFMTDERARIAALQSGQVDLIYVSPASHKTVQGLVAGGRVALHTYPANGFEAIMLNLDKVNDPAFRMALMRGIDRQSIDMALLDGQCQPSTQPVGPDRAGSDPGLDARLGYDPTAARAALAQSSRRTLDLYVNASSPVREMAPAVTSQLEQLGIAVRTIDGDPAALYADFARGEGDAYLLSIATDFFAPQVVAQATYDVTRMDKNAPREMLEARAAAYDPNVDDQERVRLTARMNTLVAENALIIPVCRTGISVAASSAVTGLGDMAWPESRRVFDVRAVGVGG